MERAPFALAALVVSSLLASSLSAQDPTYTDFGAGCTGTFGVPILTALNGDLPFLGEIFETEVTQLPFPTAGIGFTGRSTTLWGALPLPFDLAAIGMPGCLLHMDVRLSRTLMTTPGIATWSTPIPNDTALLGQDFYQQAFIIDAGVPGLGASMSNATHGVIGVSPDLLISTGEPTPTPTTIHQGGSVSVTGFTVKNSGSGPAGSFSVAYYLSPNSNITSSDQFLVSLPTVAGLAPGGTITYGSRDITIPLNTNLNQKFLGVLADWGNNVPESNKANNDASSPLTITLARPDLVVSSGNPTLTPSTLELGLTTQISAVTVQNIGTAPSNGFQIQYYLSTDNVITTLDTLVGSGGTGSLVPGETHQFAARTLTIPVSIGTGARWIGVIVDWDDRILELNESNNTAASPVTLTSALPDLIPLSLQITPFPTITYPAPGSPAPLTFFGFVVENLGQGTAPAFRIGYYLSQDSVITTADTLLGSVNVGSIPGGSTTFVSSQNFSIPNPVAGTHFVGIFVDDQFDVLEGNESDNTKSLQVTIAPLF